MPTIQRMSMATVGAMCLTLGTAGVGRAIVTFGDPNDPMYIAQPGMFSGVGSIDLTTPGSEEKSHCTGSLLNGGYDILTAAHCVTNDDGSFNSSRVGNTVVTFNPTTGSVTLPVSNFYVPFDSNNNDIAVLRLAQPAPANAEQYSIYRNADEVGQTFTKVGYGNNGNGNVGEIEENFDGKLRYGNNRYDALNDILKKDDIAQLIDMADTPPGSQLIYDFNNGNPANDAFRVHFGFSSNNKELGSSEVNTARGDSGSPGFIGNLIASVNIGGFNDVDPSFPDGLQADIDQKLNSTFGEFSNETRVSYYQNFIDDVSAGRITPVNVPEPSATWGLFTLSGLGIFSWLKRKKGYC